MVKLFWIFNILMACFLVFYWGVTEQPPNGTPVEAAKIATAVADLLPIEMVLSFWVVVGLVLGVLALPTCRRLLVAEADEQ
jgi:hypothetical protein